MFSTHILSVLPIAQLGERQTAVLKVEPDLVDIKTLLTQLVECQPHELKAVGSIPIRGVSCFISIFLTTLKISLNKFFSHTSLKFSCTTFSILIFSLSRLNKFCETIEISIKTLFHVYKFSYFGIAK